MLFLVVAFIAILGLTFGLVAVLTRPTRDQKKIQRRFASLSTENKAALATDHKIEEYLLKPESQSFASLEKLVTAFGAARKLRLLLLQADSKTSAGSVVFYCAAAAAAGFVLVYYFTATALLALLGAAFAAYLPIAYLQYLRSRRMAAFDKALPACIDMTVRALRAGYSIVAAINVAADQAVEPAKTEFGEVYKKQSYGLPVREAWMQMLERVPSADLRVLITGILVQKDTGGNLAELMDRMSNVIRERIRIQGEIRVNTAQGRMTGWILTLFPVVMTILMNFESPGYSKVLFTDPTGRMFLYGGVAMMIVGGLIIRNIVKGIEV
jgi:tight adherence protein B